MAWLEGFKSKREERRVDSLEKKRILITLVLE